MSSKRLRKIPEVYGKRKKNRIALLGALLLVLALCLGGCGGKEEGKTLSLTNVSYDPTRELYTEYNALFTAGWEKTGGKPLTITQSHGGSGSQAISVSQGLEADVVTLALEADIRAIEKAGLIREGWRGELPKDSAPYTSTIVFLVRRGNPKGILDWPDLAREGVGVITPNPKTSGGARWNFLAAWAYAQETLGGGEEACRDFVGAIFRNVLVLDSGARGSTTSFVENGQGDVLIAWENEAMLTLQQHPGEYEMVAPSISILCQPSVAVVDEVVDKRGTREMATAYLEGLYAPETQRLVARYFYRPSDPDILQEFADSFDLSIRMTNIDHFGGWGQAQQRFFADGGVFDQIYEK
jgi:sulfate transport system substrate-binding protein